MGPHQGPECEPDQRELRDGGWTVDIHPGRVSSGGSDKWNDALDSGDEESKDQRKEAKFSDH
jgi:hypothetical protein